MSSITGIVTIVGTVESGRISPWQDYAIEKRRCVKTDGTRKTYHEVIIDGDNEGVELTLKGARKYVQELRDSWLENHPGETIN